ncbi:MAG: stage 0 sporulation family protein, partial [Schaedlerella sp.]|uniref:PSP1 domain-containing protein n=1 Tax=Schaedlerella sp. TaxID=2676057 RepID=UPI00352997E9
MIKVIGVRFRTAGKVYFFDPGKFEIKQGDHVIVETARGIEYGTVIGAPREVEDDKVVQPLKSVLRIANQKDDEQEAANRQKEKDAFKICLEKIRKHGLQMKLIDAEYTFDNNKVLFYFTADGRIDFRELVKDLASVFKTRIELRQIGVRDETKILGGIGICGRPLCCHTHLSEFAPVSIKMAKEQNLSLNPTKISGVCGRLMCCLKNEEETYEELNRKLPNVGDFVTTDDGLKGEVHSVNVLRQLVKVVVDVGDEKE